MDWQTALSAKVHGQACRMKLLKPACVWFILLAGIGFLFFAFGGVTIGDGGYILTVLVQSKSSIDVSCCRTFRTLEEADEFREMEVALERARVRPEPTEKRHSIEVHVNTVSRTSICLGRDLGRVQDWYATVVVRFAGRIVTGKVVEIPDSRSSQFVKATFP